jgi:hypothetical protein
VVVACGVGDKDACLSHDFWETCCVYAVAFALIPLCTTRFHHRRYWCLSLAGALGLSLRWTIVERLIGVVGLKHGSPAAANPRNHKAQILASSLPLLAHTCACVWIVWLCGVAI